MIGSETKALRPCPGMWPARARLRRIMLISDSAAGLQKQEEYVEYPVIMEFYQSLLWRWLPTLLLSLSLLVLCSSCTEIQSRSIPAAVAAPEPHTHALAEQFFMLGDYERALLEYEQIYETALALDDKNHALYGLACTQMMLARTKEQLVEAIDNLQKWDVNKGTAPFTENRHLLILALKQQGNLLLEKDHTFIDQENRQKSVIANLQSKISEMTAENENLQIELKKLQKQIEEIEAIDENVQSKRKPL